MRFIKSLDLRRRVGHGRGRGSRYRCSPVLQEILAFLHVHSFPTILDSIILALRSPGSNAIEMSWKWHGDAWFPRTPRYYHHLALKASLPYTLQFCPLLQHLHPPHLPPSLADSSCWTPAQPYRTGKVWKCISLALHGWRRGSQVKLDSCTQEHYSVTYILFFSIR